MRSSSSGFARTSQGFYPTRTTLQSQASPSIPLTIPHAAVSGTTVAARQHSQGSSAYAVNRVPYFQPEHHQTSMASQSSFHQTRSSMIAPHSLDRHATSQHVVAQPHAVYTNNFMNEGSSYAALSSKPPLRAYSPPRVIVSQQPLTTTQVIYKPNLFNDTLLSSSTATAAAAAALHHPVTFEASAIANQMRTTGNLRLQTQQAKSSSAEIAELNEVQLDRVRVYRPQNIERVFGRDVTFECNYEPLKLFSAKDIRGFLANNFDEFDRNLRRLEANFTGLESSFFHLLHKAESPKDIFDRFLIALDKRVEKFFEVFNETVVQQQQRVSEYFDVHALRNDFEFWNFKTVIKQGVVEISNKVNDLFLARDNSTHYDAQVVRAMETILRIFQFLKNDLNGVLHRSLLKYGRILELCTYDFNGGEALKSVNFAEFVQLDVHGLVQSFNDDFERSYPVLLSKKQIIAEKFHELLRDKSTQNAFDLKQLVRSVFSRERRKVYSTIYNVIAKSGKELGFGLTEDIENENKIITERMNKIKEKFLELKADPLYLEVLSGRINVESLRNSQTLFDDNPQGVLLLESFMVAVQNLIGEIRSALEDIIRYKETEAAHYKSVFESTLSNAVYDLTQQEKRVQERGDMSEYMLQQFVTLEKALDSDNERQSVDSTIDERLFQQLKKNSGNYHLHNIAADIAREGKEKDQKRITMLENQMRKTQEYSQQIAGFMTKPMVDRDRSAHAIREKENNERASRGDTKGLADKLLETIKWRREEELERETKMREEQEEVRLMKEQQFREEKERVQAERNRSAELTSKKFREKREQEQAELQQRIAQREQESESRKLKDIERSTQKVLEREREEENRRKGREDEQERIRRQKEEDDRKRRERDEEDKARKIRAEEETAAAARKKREAAEDEDRRKREKKQEDDARKAKADEDARKKKEDDDKRRREKEEEDNRRKRDEEDRKRKKEEDDDRKRKDEEDRRKKKEEDDRRKKQEDDDRRRKQEDDDRRRKQEDDDRRRKQEDDDRRRKQEEDDRRRKEEEDRRKKKEDDDRRKKEEDDRRRKQEDDDRRRKEEEEEQKRKKKEDEDRRKKEDEERRKREDEDRKRKEDADRKRREAEEEEEAEQERQRQAEKSRRDAEEKAKQQQKATKPASSGIDYGNIGGSDGSDDQYKYDFDEDEFDVEEPVNKKKDAAKPAKVQSSLYDEISEDSGNFNDMIVGGGKGAPAKTNTAKDNKNSKKATDVDLDFDYDNFDDDDIPQKSNTSAKQPPAKSALPPLIGGGAGKKAAPAKSNFNYDIDEDFNVDDDEDDEIAQVTASKKVEVKSVAKSQSPAVDDEYDFDYDEEIEEDIDIAPPTEKNAKPATTAVTTSNQPNNVKKPTSNFDYGFDIDDEEEEGNNIDDNRKPQQPQKPAQKIETTQKQQSAKKISKDEDEDFDYDYDMPEDIADDGVDDDGDIDAEPVAPKQQQNQQQQQQKQPQQNQGARGQQQDMSKEEMEELIRQQDEEQQEQFEVTYQLIAKTNEYIKKTRFGRSNHVNLNRFNNFESVIRLYEEYIQNIQVYLFNVSEGDRLISLFELYASQSEYFEKEADAFANELQEQYYESTKFTDYSPETKLYFALQPNQFGFQLIEVNMAAKAVSYFYMVEEEEEESLMEQLQVFHSVLAMILNVEGFEASPVKIEDNSLKVLQIYEKEPYLQYMIMLFPLVYEFFSDVSTIVVDQATIDRIFYIQLSLENFYTDLEQNQEAVNQKFTGLLDTYQAHKDFVFSSTAYEEFSTEALQMLLEDLDGLKNAVLDSADKKYGLAYFEIVVQENPVCYYFYVQKSLNPQSEPHEIGLFCLTLFDQINNDIIQSLEQLADDQCQYRPHVEPSRHNGLYEYNEFTLSSWAQLIDKKKLTPFIAINIINFSMIPYYVIFKGND